VHVIGQAVMVDDEWLPIEYRDFYDLPRAFFVRHDDRWLYALSEFDADSDEFGDYRVFDLGERGPDQAASDWRAVPEAAIAMLGTVSLTSDSFDPTRRKSITVNALNRWVESA
jgi:hypothetical protein